MDSLDSTSTLHIVTYPFCYNLLTTDVRFYKDYSFDISYTVSLVALTSLTNDKDVYQEGDTVVIDIRLGNSGEVSGCCCQQVDKAIGAG